MRPFGGIMPDNALAAGKEEFVSGLQIFGPLANAPALPDYNQAIGVVEGTWKTSRARAFTLGITPNNYPGSGNFPPAGPSVTQAGIVNAAGAAFGGGSALRLACLLEYGVGSAVQKAVCDWQPGTYNLPPCQFVRISALPWGTAWNANASYAAAAISAGHLEGAPVPTVTGLGVLLAATAQSFTPPAYARAFEFWNGDNTTTPALTGRFFNAGAGVSVTRNYATGAFTPGFTPIEFYSAALSLLSDVDTVAVLRWYLSL